jgi:hypothetical protein
MGSAWMPYTSLRGITLMSNPDVGIKVFKLIVLGYLLGITDNLEYHHVSAVRKDKGLFVAQSTV